MVRVSNFIVGLVNSLSLLLGLAAAISGLYFLIHGGTQCQESLSDPLLITGGFVFLFSVLGLIGVWGKNNLVMFIYLTAMFVLLMGIIGFTVFVFLVTDKAVGEVVSERGYKQYKTSDYGHWLERHFVDGKKWDRVRACLVETHVCKNLASKKESDFIKKTLTPIQLGCCKPPRECGFQFKNATFWDVPASGPASNITDCRTWSNNKDMLCYNCNSCKSGFLANIEQQWRHLLFFNICLTVVLVLVYSIGVCAWRSNRRESRKRGGFP
ncbi:hypothetical protein SLE2022_364980 [Rubroshorea leprosula]